MSHGEELDPNTLLLKPLRVTTRKYMALMTDQRTISPQCTQSSRRMVQNWVASARESSQATRQQARQSATARESDKTSMVQRADSSS